MGAFARAFFLPPHLFAMANEEFTKLFELLGDIVITDKQDVG
jgi:hypothetical protein